METLLISPATRPEIVTGKFLTVVLASIASALLNLLSMGITAFGLTRQLAATRAAGAEPSGLNPMAALTPPSLEALFWMIVLLVPLSVFFSALCVALAAMARSMKEGQYYLTPLYLLTMPLVFLTLAPGIELSLFTSLLPVTGPALLMRTLMNGDYATARQYFLVVLVPLVVYGALALRWAVDQFRSESVLFRESERFDLAGWLRHVVRDREPLPTAGEALLCFALLVGASYFATTLNLFGASWVGIVASQVGIILLVPVVMTLLLTSSPRATLLLRRPRGRHLALGAGLALSLNPLVGELRRLVELMFPLSDDLKKGLETLLGSLQELGFLPMLVILALIPAICEEVAFRGFILQGLRRGYREGSAIVLSALLFGFLHVLMSLFQQLFNATLLGLVLGLLAVRSASLLPGIVFHAINNGLALVVGAVAAGELGSRVAPWLFRDAGQGLYHGVWVGVGAVVSVVLIAALWRDRAPVRLDEPSAPGVPEP